MLYFDPKSSSNLALPRDTARLQQLQTVDLETQQSDIHKNFEEARQRALNALKTSFTKQRNKGLLTDGAVTVLKQAVDSVQSDSTSVQFVSINQLKRNWKLFGLIIRLKSGIEHYLYGKNFI